MNIDQSEKEKLYKGFELFRESFADYIITVLKRNVGESWENEFLKTLSPIQMQSWEKKVRQGKSAENLIDFHHFKYFAIRNKDLLREDFDDKTNRLPTLLEEIIDARNNYAHFDAIDEDEAAKAWINMRSIAKYLGHNDLEQKFRELEKSASIEKNPETKSAASTAAPTPTQESAKEIKQKPSAHISKPVLSDSSSIETLDIVNCANADFRQTVFSHEVYVCPAAGGAYKHKQCKYLGIYWEKRVGAVAEIAAVIDVLSERETSVYYVNGDKSVKNYESKAREKALNLRPNNLPVRVFLLEDLTPTNFIKDSPGGMFGNKIYLNVDDLSVETAPELAEKLNGRRYSAFGL